MTSSKSQKLEVVAICTPTPGKMERLKEVIAAFIETAKAREPGVLDFRMVEELDAAEPQFVMIESYADSAAKDAHATTSHHKTLFAQFEEEGLFAKPPAVFVGKAVAGFTR